MPGSIHKAAVALKSLGKRDAARIMSKLEPLDMKAVVAEANKTPEPDEEEILSTLNELSAEVESLLYDDDKKRQILNSRNQIQPGSDRNNPFHFLNRLAPAIRDSLIRDEHPESIAIILMHLPKDIASNVMKSLENETQVSVVRRLCQFNENNPEKVSNLAFNLKIRLQKKLNRSESEKGIHLAAQLLSCTDAQTREHVLTYINQLDPELVSDLQHSILRFEQLASFDNVDIQVILKNVDTSFWAPALKQATIKVREKLLSNMAPAAASILSREIAEIGPIEDSLATHAQSQVINTCLQLKELGKINLPSIPVTN